MTFLFATTNPNKVREVRHALRTLAPRKGVPYKILTLDDVGSMPEPEETASTYWENARIKALAYAQATDLTTIAEDSGFEVDALGGAPGVQSARFLGAATSYPDRFAEIYRRLTADKPKGLSPQQSPGGRRLTADKPKGLSPQQSPGGDKPLGLSYAARFVTALAVARGHELLFETASTIEGTVAPQPRGQYGFGYDPIFLYPPLGGTIAELSDDQKATVSHRARAFRDLHRWLKTRE